MSSIAQQAQGHWGHLSPTERDHEEWVFLANVLRNSLREIPREYTLHRQTNAALVAVESHLTKERSAD